VFRGRSEHAGRSKASTGAHTASVKNRNDETAASKSPGDRQPDNTATNHRNINLCGQLAF
jgi:hypothetical protein